MKNGSAEEVLRAVEAVQPGKFMLAHPSRRLPPQPVKAMCQDAPTLLPSTPKLALKLIQQKLIEMN